MSDYNFYSKSVKKRNIAKIFLIIIIALSLVAVCFGVLYMLLYNDKDCKSVQYSYNVLNSDSTINSFINGTTLSDCDGTLKSDGNILVTSVTKSTDDVVTISYDSGLNGKSGERSIVLPVKEKMNVNKFTNSDGKVTPMKLSMTFEPTDKFNEFKSRFCSKFDVSFCTVNVTLSDWSIEENNIVITKENFGEYKNYLLKYGMEWVIKNMNFASSNKLYSALPFVYANISSTLNSLKSDAEYVEYVSEFLNSSVKNRIINNTPNGLTAMTCVDIKTLIKNLKECGALCENNLEEDFISKLESACEKYNDSYVTEYTLKSSFAQLSPYVDISSTWSSHSNDTEYLRSTAQIISDFLNDPSFLKSNLIENYLPSDISKSLDIISKNANSCGNTCTDILSSVISGFAKYYVVKENGVATENHLLSESNYLTGDELKDYTEMDCHLLWLDGYKIKRLAYLLYETDNNYTQAEKQSILLYYYYSYVDNHYNKAYINGRYNEVFKYNGPYNVADTALELYKYTNNPIYKEEYDYIYKNSNVAKYNDEDRKDRGLIGSLSYLSFYNNYNGLNNISNDDIMTVAVKKANDILNVINTRPNDYDYAAVFADSYLLKIISIL